MILVTKDRIMRFSKKFYQTSQPLFHCREFAAHQSSLTYISSTRVKSNNVLKFIDQLRGCSTKDVLNCDKMDASD